MPKTKQAAPVAGLTSEQTARMASLKAKQAKEKLSADETGELADLGRIAYVAEKQAQRSATPKAAPAKKAPRRIAKASNKAPAKKGAKEGSRGSANEAADGRIPLKAICQKLDIDPKRARVVLRRRLRAGELAGGTHEIGGGRWNLTPAKAELVRETLKTFLREQA